MKSIKDVALRFVCARIGAVPKQDVRDLRAAYLATLDAQVNVHLAELDALNEGWRRKVEAAHADSSRLAGTIAQLTARTHPKVMMVVTDGRVSGTEDCTVSAVRPIQPPQDIYPPLGLSGPPPFRIHIGK